jgi:RHH-type rel operon transcriptional repressor/antitoxin RelB
MLALRLPPEIERRLEALAAKTGRSKSYYARQAILEHLDELEDGYLARERLLAGGPTVTLEGLEAAFAAELANEDPDLAGRVQRGRGTRPQEAVARASKSSSAISTRTHRRR